MDYSKHNEELARKIGLPLWGDGYSVARLPDFYGTDGMSLLFRYVVPKEWDDKQITAVQFRYLPGGVQCTLTVETNSGFDEVHAWIPNEEPYLEKDSKKNTVVALAEAAWKALCENKIKEA